jgi:opine dehydrogenase
MVRVTTICVIGSGNGAFGVAANLALSGRKVILYDCPLFADNLNALIAGGNKITLTGAGLNGEAKLYQVTGDLEAALYEAELTLVVIPSFAQGDTARRLAEVVKPGAKIFLCSGSTGGTLEMAKIFQDLHVRGVRLGEFATLPYGCRKTGPQSVNVATSLKFNQFAAFPASDTDELYADAVDLFSVTEKARDVMECSFNNSNIVLHGPVMLLNAAHTEGSENNFHYRDGCTPSITGVMDKIDAERMQVCRSLGYSPISTAEATVRKGYCPSLENTSYATFRGSGDFMTSPGPTTLNHRYITEDIPYSALVVSVFGKLLGVKTPLTDAVITLCGALMNTDYFSKGRTAETMGVAGMTRNKLRTFLKYGY